MFLKNHRYIFISHDLPEHETTLVMAHELGHAIIHRKQNCYFIRNKTLLLTSKLELEANRFAGELLIPFIPMAIIGLLPILPSITILNSGFRLLKIFRLFRSLRVLRVFKITRYSKSIVMIVNVFRNQRRALLTVCNIAIAYVLISALLIPNIEPDSFNSYFDAVYRATVSLTTMGYGDIYPVSVAGRIVTMIFAVFGIAIIALPASIITAGMMKEIENNKE